MVAEVPRSAVLRDPPVPSRPGLHRAAAGKRRGGPGSCVARALCALCRRHRGTAGPPRSPPPRHQQTLPGQGVARWLGGEPLRGAAGRRESKQRKGKIRRRKKKKLGHPKFSMCPITGGPQVPWFPLASSPRSNCVFQLSSRSVAAVKFHCTLSAALHAAIPAFLSFPMQYAMAPLPPAKGLRCFYLLLKCQIPAVSDRALAAPPTCLCSLS